MQIIIFILSTIIVYLLIKIKAYKEYLKLSLKLNDKLLKQIKDIEINYKIIFNKK